MLDENFSLHRLYKFALSTLLALVILTNHAVAAQPRQRIHGDLYDGARFALEGNVRPSIARAQDLGAVSPSLPLGRMTLHFSMTPSQNADLMQLLRLQQTKHSSQYHKWLTREEFASRFGVNEKDIEKVTAWLESQGFTNLEVAATRNLIMFDGTAAQAQAAFNTSIHKYVLNGETHYANATEPELPAALNGFVQGIRGLHDFHPRPHAHPHFTSNISGNHFLVPDDLATIYDLQALYGQGITGAGITIAIPGQTNLDPADIAAFRTAANLPPSVPTIVPATAVCSVSGTPYTTCPSAGASDLGESDLDVEWAGGIAKGAQIVFVNQGDVFTSLTYALTTLSPVPDVVAVTYGSCEADTGVTEIRSLNNTFSQANSMGITITAASGDDGAADCDGDTTTPNTPVTIAAKGFAVDFPAASPYVTGVGGTSFTINSSYWNTANNANGGSAISYVPESAWNDTTADGQLAASGGGFSTFNSKPSWQVGTGVPNDGQRDVPDVALVASPNNEEGGYLICSAGSCVNGFRRSDTTLNVSGGTSASSPSFAGIVALLVQKTNSAQGNINQNLYTLASVSTDAFHDITSGNNVVPCKGGTPNCSSTVAAVNGTLGYSTGTGYDQVTGLGSVDGLHLLNEWGEDLTSSISPTTLSVSRGTSGTATVNLTESAFTANTTFTCSVASALTNTTCSIPGTVSGSGSTTLTISADATAGTPPVTRFPGGWFSLLACLTMAAAVFLMFAPLTGRKKMRLWPAAAAILLVAGLSSCGSGGSSTSTTSSVVTPETGLVTVVAHSGTLTSTSTISVTVQ